MGRGSGSPRAGAGSRDADQNELFGADPSIAPGLPRPVGWRVSLPDGTAAWDKTGVLDTNWTPISAEALAGVAQVVAGTGIGVSPAGGTGVVTVSNNGVRTLTAGTNITLGGTAQNPVINAAGGAAVTSLVAGDSGITITNPTGPAVTVGQQLGAEWTIDRTRVYAVDGVNGNDANAGFADPASTSSADYAIASAAAGAVAKKTFAGLAAIFPRIGNGRLVEAQIAPGTYAGSPADFLNGANGYNTLIVRGTGTVATGGAVAFAGTTQDATVVGGVTATGLNAAGYTPAGTITTSSIECTQVGGGAPAFAATPALPLGVRIRFDIATTTAALRNICRQVSRVPLSDTVQVQTVEPALPVAGDTFYTEQPGVICSGNAVFNNLQTGLAAGVIFVGIAFGGTVSVNSGRATFAFCTAANSVDFRTMDRVFTQQNYSHPVLGTLTCGGGLRVTGSITYQNGNFSMIGAVSTTTQTVLKCLTINWFAGCAAQALFVLNLNVAQNDDTQQAPQIGVFAATSVGIPFTFGASNSGGINFDGCQCAIGNVDVTGAGASPAIKIRGRCQLVVFGTITGSTGNTDVGMDFQNAVLSTVELRASQLPTVTGTAGNLRWANNALGVWTNFNFEEAYDHAGNRIFEGNTNGAAYQYAINPSVANGVVNNGSPIAAYALVRNLPAGASYQVAAAQADTLADASALAGVMLAGANNGAACLYGGMSGYKIVVFDQVNPVVGSIAYLSNLNAGQATTTVPPVSVTAVKLRIGIVVANNGSGLGTVRMSPEILPVLADGNP